MLCVYGWRKNSGTAQIDVSNPPTASTGTATGSVRHGRRESHTNNAPARENVMTTMCDSALNANNSAGNHGLLPVSSVFANDARKNNDSEIASVYENSPARLLARLPP